MAKIQVDSLPQTSIDNLTILLETKVAASRSPQTQLSNLIYLSNDDQLIGNMNSLNIKKSGSGYTKTPRHIKSKQSKTKKKNQILARKKLRK